MTWPQYSAARLLLSEEHHGILVRAGQRKEDDEVDRLKDAIRRQPK